MSYQSYIMKKRFIAAGLAACLVDDSGAMIPQLVNVVNILVDHAVEANIPS